LLRLTGAPSRSKKTSGGGLQVNSQAELTAAGLLPIRTAFPFKSLKSDTKNGAKLLILPQEQIYHP
jgi:hypothetical protein